MWLLILAIVLLVLSSPLIAYIVSCLKEDRMLRPAVFWQYERFLVYGSFVPFLAGIIILFIVAGWKWGLGSLAIYWLLVVFVLIPLADRVRRGKSP